MQCWLTQQLVCVDWFSLRCLCQTKLKFDCSDKLKRLCLCFRIMRVTLVAAHTITQDTWTTRAVAYELQEHFGIPRSLTILLTYHSGNNLLRPRLSHASAARLVDYQWRRLHGARGTRAPKFTNGWAQGAPWVEEQQTRNWPNCIDHHESAHQND